MHADFCAFLQALRQIEELKTKQEAGVALEKTQMGKIEREEELRTELEELMGQGDENEGPQVLEGVDAMRSTPMAPII